MRFLYLLVLVPFAFAAPRERNPDEEPKLVTASTALPIDEEPAGKTETGSVIDDGTDGMDGADDGTETDPESEAESEVGAAEPADTVSASREEGLAARAPEVSGARNDESHVSAEVEDQADEENELEYVSLRTAFHAKWNNTGDIIRSYTVEAENKSDRDICGVTFRLTGTVHEDFTGMIRNDDGTFTIDIRIVPGARSKSPFHSTDKADVELESFKYCNNL